MVQGRSEKFLGIIHHVILAGVSFLTIYPVLWVLKLAFGLDAGLSTSLSLLPSRWTLENFHYLFFECAFARWLLNSAVIAPATAVMGLLLACSAAYAYSRFRFPGRGTGLMSFLVSQMFPGTLTLIPIYLILDWLKLLDKNAGLIFVYSTTSVPFCVWMLKGYFDTIPKELEEAARVDGASSFTIFRRIMLPLARPAIAITGLFSFMSAWNEFILAATIMNSENAYTLPVGLQSFVGQFSSEWGYFAAGAVLVSMPIIALFFLLQKHLVSGLLAGSTKG
jgi:arabinogalactan oligomer / maltooligosaccharide transport system permease protein